MTKKRYRRKKKKVMISIFTFLIVLCVGTSLFINLNPAFGGKHTDEEKEYYQKLNNYDNDKFVNEIDTNFNVNILDFITMLKDSLMGSKDLNPDGAIPISLIDWDRINSENDSLTWLGHSSFLLSIDDKKILIDPMFSSVASPVSFAGSKRYEYSEDLMTIIDKMPQIDIVFISHDHYDHLDYKSILKLKSKVEHFFVPLGVGAHLIRWGVSEEAISEMNWWDETEYQDLNIALTPARHFSGRGIFNRNSTLWGGWVILGENTRLYMSGDGGYGSHFKKIGKKYGPFDIALVEGAQYHKLWPDSHMTPEQALQANMDVVGKNMMLMHWGAFTLAFHNWKEPIERIIEAAEKEEISLIAPQIGETIQLDSVNKNSISSWWDY